MLLITISVYSGAITLTRNGILTRLLRYAVDMPTVVL